MRLLGLLVITFKWHIHHTGMRFISGFKLSQASLMLRLEFHGFGSTVVGQVPNKANNNAPAAQDAACRRACF
jgi:hypothetical protein